MAETQLSTIQTLKGYLSADSVKSRFQEMLGKKAAGFTASVLSVASNNALLSKADPKSILNSAMVAATLDLPVNQNLGFAYIVPFYDGKTRTTNAQLQIGWRGFVQLAERSGQYKTINVVEIYEGQIKSSNPVTGKYELGEPISDTIVGYMAYFELINGFEKYLYWTKEQCEKHGRQYSQTYKKGGGVWASSFDDMAKKTVLKQLLSKWGMLSIEMQRAQVFDQAVVKTDLTEENVSVDEAEIYYADNDQASARTGAFMDADAEDAEIEEEEKK